MSGTSLDGVDVAIVEVGRGRSVETVGFQSTRYPDALRAAILGISGGGWKEGGSNTGKLSALNFRLGEVYAKAVLRAVKRFGPVQLIGCHGQTVYHEGGKHTLQIGEPAVIAERTGVPVVSNFRARDIAAGGQGAPLVPYVDYLLFRHPRRTRVALNIGGIANITVIPRDAVPREIAAFDTGPGNMVIDGLAQEYSQGKLRYDQNGRIAQSGRVNENLLKELLADPYYRKKPPKSVGREQYGSEFIARLKRFRLPLRDLIATVTVLTADTISAAIRMRCKGPIDVIAAGGGVHNPRIMGRLAENLPEAIVSTSSDFGVDPDAKEAVAFAVLACETWRRNPANLPSATGARRAVILGSITP